VRKILVTAAPVFSDAAANSLPDCLKGGRLRGRPAFPIRKAQKHNTKAQRVPVRSDTAIAMEPPYG
jgi:hypothetical protein